MAAHQLVTFGNFVTYLVAEMLGAFLGAVLAWLAYKQHFDQEAEPAVKLGVFSTGPEIRSYGWNFVTDVIGSFVLMFVILWFAGTPQELGPLAVALLVLGIGASLGGPTGYAINPARDLRPRIAHALLPIPGKGPSDWSYSWVPVVGHHRRAHRRSCCTRQSGSDSRSTDDTATHTHDEVKERRHG